MRLHLLLGFSILAYIASCQEIAITYGKRHFGTISYDKETGGATFILDPNSGAGLLKQPQCFSTGDIEGHECFSYATIANQSNPLQSMQFWVMLTENKDISHITVASGEHAEGEAVVVKLAASAPAVVLNNAAHQKKANGGAVAPPPQKIIITKKVEDEDGNEVEIQEEQIVPQEQQLSWIEQNWKYCLIGFLVYLTMNGGKGQEEEQPAK